MAAPTQPFPDPFLASGVHHSVHEQNALHHHNRDLALQKYLLLQEQHESLRHHLDQLRPLDNPFMHTSSLSRTDAIPQVFSRSSSISSSNGYSHTDARRRASLPEPTLSDSAATTPSSSFCHPASYSPPSYSSGLLATSCAGGGGSALAAVPDEETLGALAADEARLAAVTEGIKRTLTELLNCETVRHDASFRGWVQTRLMETEKELRVRRRRRSAGSYGGD